MVRRDKDFNVLREYLNKVYPHIMVPVIGACKQKKEYEPKFLRNRQNMLQRFMNKICQSETLRACPMLQDFLKYEDEKNFTK